MIKTTIFKTYLFPLHHCKLLMFHNVLMANSLTQCKHVNLVLSLVVYFVFLLQQQTRIVVKYAIVLYQRVLLTTHVLLDFICLPVSVFYVHQDAQIVLIAPFARRVYLI